MAANIGKRYKKSEEFLYAVDPMNYAYREISNISRTQSANINVSHLVLQLFLPNLLKPGVKLRMKM